MTPSEKERIIKEGFDAIRKVYNLRDDLLEDAGKLEAVTESNRKKKDEIKRLKEELEAEKKIHCCDKCVCSVKKEYELLRKAHAKLCSDYDTLSKTTVTKESFHELRQRLSKLYLYHVHDMLETKDLIAFTDWFTETFGDFGVYDEEE